MTISDGLFQAALAAEFRRGFELGEKNAVKRLRAEASRLAIDRWRRVGTNCFRGAANFLEEVTGVTAHDA